MLEVDLEKSKAAGTLDPKDAVVRSPREPLKVERPAQAALLQEPANG
jgi:hypothetical protein